MIDFEGFYDRLEIQPGYNLDNIKRANLIICGDGMGMIKTLSLSAISCGFQNIQLVGRSEKLRDVADQTMLHLDPVGGLHIPVFSQGFFKMRYSLETPKNTRVWLIDAGDSHYDTIVPGANEPALFYAEGARDDKEFIRFGTNRDKVTAFKKGFPVRDRAEISGVCAHLIIGAIAGLKACPKIEPLSDVCEIHLERIPDDIRNIKYKPSTRLFAGGGGAIAHQEFWAEFLDPVLNAANANSHIIIVDPKTVHPSCRARQWAYPPQAVGDFKSRWTAKWIRERALSGVEVTHYSEKLSECHFKSRPVHEAFASIDNWSGRKRLWMLSKTYGRIPFWSTGSSFYGGFCRFVDPKNPWCASPDDGVERLLDRPDDENTDQQTSCSDASTPLPSSVLPQLLIAHFISTQRREILLGRLDHMVLARGIEVHIDHESEEPGFEGLRYSPGRRLNIKKRK